MKAKPLIVIAAILLVVSHVGAQERSRVEPCRPIGPERQVGSPDLDLPYCSPNEPAGYEINRGYVSDAAERAKKFGLYVIVIARLGTGEGARHNRARLNEIKTYLEQVVEAKAIIAEGERVRGFGRLEIYVAGKQLYVLPLRKTATLGLLPLSP